MTAFDKYSELDTAKFMRDVEELHGSAFFDIWAFLSDEHRVMQMETAFGTDFSNAALLDPARLIEECVIAGSGSSAPDWVPDDAKIYIDLVGNRAWTEADGEVAIDTLLGSDPNTENGWGTSLYDEANLGAHGYGPVASSLAPLGSTLTKVLTGATVVLRNYATDEFSNTTNFALLSADGNDAIELYTHSNGMSSDSYSGSLSISTAGVWNTGVAGAINVIAFTTVSNRMDVALNGSDAVSGVVDATDRPPGNPFVAAIFQVPNGNALQSITIYDALPDTTGLSALSEVS